MPSQIATPEEVSKIRGAALTGPVLSLYLPLDDVPAVDRGFVARAKDLLNPLKTENGGAVEVERALEYVNDMTPAGRTLVLFSSAGDRFLEALHLQVRLPGLAKLDAQPYVAPLDAAFDNYPRVAVVAFGERDAKIIETNLAQIVGVSSVSDDVPSHQRQGGWAAFKIDRDRDEHVRGHYRHIAEKLHELSQGGAFKRLVLLGAPESTSGLTEELEPALERLVVGSAHIATYENDDQIVATGLELAAAEERREEATLVEEIRDRAFAGGKASLGWDETFTVLREGRVHRLAIAESVLGSTEAAQAVQLAWDTGAEVEFLQAEAAAMLADNGGVGALLRY
ncbi:MAG: hypothetical protein AB7P33_13325 [Dehalococcoidia bacterium]